MKKLKLIGPIIIGGHERDCIGGKCFGFTVNPKPRKEKDEQRRPEQAE